MKTLSCTVLGIITGALLLSTSTELGVAAPSSETLSSPSVQEVSVVIPAAPGQTYEQLLQMAIVEAQTLLEQTFATKAQVSAVTVTILAERKGQEVPLTVVRVSRTEWQAQPYAQQWSKQYPGISSQVLLGFLTPDLKPVAEPISSYPTGNSAEPAANSNPTNSDYSRYNDPNDVVR